MKKAWFKTAVVLLSLSLTSCKENTQNTAGSDRSEAIEAQGNPDISPVTSLPNVPAPVSDRKAKELIVNLEVIEKVGELADGTQYNFWTFNGTVPGAFIRARTDDEIELHLKNNENNTFPTILI
ncbi:MULTISPECIES: multicopper oxidase domain-containing protein [Chryseobacterium]|uniref:Copper-containing nitrite reductase n=1 Tax=Chryseobacterium indoltheticum TaxID=254 RepID=A0A381FIJ0_9FLAO|nr:MULTISPECIES: multicopper oxidase domain-containing protein [Chryseobacterium]OCK49654.1 hypothetical protein BA768_08685 [Chryseobacterium sp. CBo1]SHM73882.1 Multicopper oxidase [Chryseobacterium carnipullorum]SUX46365.1 Copper-containing nitrite reductase precursor [Chryseobacterium indoltheticum]